MDAVAFCVSVMMNTLLLLEDSYCTPDATSPRVRIRPGRLQFFEYESISVDCEELDSSPAWRVMRRLKDDTAKKTQWETSTGSMSLLLTSDSGEYWCESNNGTRSDSVNITVTSEDVILESPPVPVREGDTVSLYCRNKKSASNVPADFYKDGVLSETGYRGNITIRNVSRSHDGLYKCSVSGAGESAESRLAVRACVSSREDNRQSPPTDASPGFPVLLSALLTSLHVAALLFVVGIPQCPEHTVFTEMSEVTYTVVPNPAEETRPKIPEEPHTSYMPKTNLSEAEAGDLSRSPRQTS